MTPKEQCMKWHSDGTVLVYKRRHDPIFQRSLGPERASARYRLTNLLPADVGASSGRACFAPTGSPEGDGGGEALISSCLCVCEDFEPEPAPHAIGPFAKLIPLEQCRYWLDHSTVLRSSVVPGEWLIDALTCHTATLCDRSGSSSLPRASTPQAVVAEFTPVALGAGETVSPLLCAEPGCNAFHPNALAGQPGSAAGWRCSLHSLKHLQAAPAELSDPTAAAQAAECFLLPFDVLITLLEQCGRACFVPPLREGQDAIRAALDLAAAGRFRAYHWQQLLVHADNLLQRGHAALRNDNHPLCRDNRDLERAMRKTAAYAVGRVRAGRLPPAPVTPPPRPLVVCDHGYDDDSGIDWAKGPGIVGSR